jgi:hypothetical protein
LLYLWLQKGRTANIFYPSSFVAVFGSGIRDKHPGSATLSVRPVPSYLWYSMPLCRVRFAAAARPAPGLRARRRVAAKVHLSLLRLRQPQQEPPPQALTLQRAHLRGQPRSRPLPPHRQIVHCHHRRYRHLSHPRGCVERVRGKRAAARVRHLPAGARGRASAALPSEAAPERLPAGVPLLSYGLPAGSGGAAGGPQGCSRGRTF